jgi:hypothetical protein
LESGFVNIEDPPTIQKSKPAKSPIFKNVAKAKPPTLHEPSARQEKKVHGEPRFQIALLNKKALTFW